jgi:hypothetical protein
MPRARSTLALIAVTAGAGALLGAQAHAAPAARSVDVPAALARQIALAKPRTDLPVLLPDRIRAEGPVFPQLIVATKGRWTMDLALARNCRQATACFFASFSGRRSVPVGGLRVGLHRGITGRFTPLRCGASCAPPSIEWRRGGVTYSIQARVRAPALRRLVALANQAIDAGPR